MDITVRTVSVNPPPFGADSKTDSKVAVSLPSDSISASSLMDASLPTSVSASISSSATGSVYDAALDAQKAHQGSAPGGQWLNAWDESEEPDGDDDDVPSLINDTARLLRVPFNEAQEVTYRKQGTRLLIGGFAAANKRAHLEDHGVTHVLSVAAELADEYRVFPKHFQYLFIHAYDMVSHDMTVHFEDAFRFIDSAMEHKTGEGKPGKVLIHCAAGISRSATILMAYMMRTFRMPYRTALRYVKSSRPFVCPNGGFVRQLEAFEQHKFDVEALKKHAQTRFFLNSKRPTANAVKNKRKAGREPQPLQVIWPPQRSTVAGAAAASAGAAVPDSWEDTAQDGDKVDDGQEQYEDDDHPQHGPAHLHDADDGSLLHDQRPRTRPFVTACSMQVIEKNIEHIVFIPPGMAVSSSSSTAASEPSLARSPAGQGSAAAAGAGAGAGAAAAAVGGGGASPTVQSAVSATFRVPVNMVDG